MFICPNCNFECKKKGDWSRHITTKKHLKLEQDNTDLKKIILKQQEQIDLQQKQINELIPKIKNITTNKFNLNIFLQDKCKDAMNWNEFINSLQIQETNDNQSISQLICNELYNLGMYKIMTTSNFSSTPRVNSYTNWGRLEEVWLGDCYPAHFYDNLESEVRDIFYEITEKTK